MHSQGGMKLRNGSLVGGSPGQLPKQLRPDFEDGVRSVLYRWTALRLATDNEWGGRDSKEKAERLFEDILGFFYDHKDHYADDLEVDLEEIMEADFNVDLEDDSPRQVAKELVSLHADLLTGKTEVLKRLRQSMLTDSMARMDMQQRPENGSASSSDDGSEGSGDQAMIGRASNGNEAVSGAEDDMSVDAPNGHATHPPAAPQEPIIDADGFQLVQSRRKGRGR